MIHLSQIEIRALRGGHTMQNNTTIKNRIKKPTIKGTALFMSYR